MAMNDDQKMAFIHKMSKLALEHVQHFDEGGQVQALSGPSAAAGSSGGVPNPNTGVAGTIGGALGLNNSYQAGSANIQQGTNAGQLQQAYNGTQSAINQQQGLVDQFQPGIAQGRAAQSTLSGQLAAQAAGLGPNPAQAALNQQTGQNINQQAALMAGQRGAGANAGLLASQAARQGAQIQQQAVGESATLNAQQQLAAQQAQQNLANQQIAQGAAGIQGLSNANQNEQNILQNANTAGNNAAVSQQSNINSVNAQTAAGNQGMAGKIIGGIASGASSVLGSIGLAKGGMVPPKSSLPEHFHSVASIYHPEYMASGGFAVAPQDPVVGAAVGNWLNSGGGLGSQIQTTQPAQMGSMDDSGSNAAASALGGAIGKRFKGGGEEPAEYGDMAGGAGDLPSGEMGGMGGGEMYASKGGAVRAEGKKEQAKVKGDSLKNDKVPAMLSEGELVIDRETMQDPGQVGQMARALAAHIQRRNKGGRK